MSSCGARVNHRQQVQVAGPARDDAAGQSGRRCHAVAPEAVPAGEELGYHLDVGHSHHYVVDPEGRLGGGVDIGHHCSLGGAGRIPAAER